MLTRLARREEKNPGRGRFTLRRGLTWAVNGLALALFLAFIAWLIVPRLLGWTPQVILSGSMEPTLKTGGIAFVAEADPSRVKVGDVLTFRRPDNSRSLVTHRVTSVLTGADGSLSFKTQGDANSTEDRWTVPATNVIGTVQWDIPYLGYLSNWVRSSEGFLVFIGLPAALLVLSELRNLFREVVRPRRKEAS